MRIRKRFLSLSAAITATPSSDLQNAHHHQPPLLLVQHQKLHPNPPSSSDHTTQIGLQPVGSDPYKTKDEMESERKQKEIIKTADTGCRKGSMLYTEAKGHDLVLKGWFEGDRLIPIKKRRGSFAEKRMKYQYDIHEEDNEMMMIEETLMKANPKKKKIFNEKRVGKGGTLMEGSRCSRVNGRGWRCSQQTLVGYSLCEHHLGKGRLRSMTNVRGRAQNSALMNKQETYKKSQDYKEADQATSIDRHYVAFEDDDDDDEEEEEDQFNDWEVESMEEGGEVVSKRRKLGVVKARSLSSLLSQK